MSPNVPYTVEFKIVIALLSRRKPRRTRIKTFIFPIRQANATLFQTNIP